MVYFCEFCTKFYDYADMRKLFHHRICINCFRIHHSAYVRYLALRKNSRLKEWIDRWYFQTKPQKKNPKRTYLKMLKEKKKVGKEEKKN